MIKHILPTLTACVLMTACSYPTSQIKTVDDRPAISISGAPPQSQLLVDGLPMGPADAYATGKQQLKLQAGTHLIRIESQGRTLHEEKIYVGDGATREIRIPGGK